MIGERLGITDQFQGVDTVTVGPDGALEILERIEGGQHQVSVCAGPPALQRAKPWAVAMGGTFASAALPSQRRATRVVKDVSPDAIAQEIVEWIRQ